MSLFICVQSSSSVSQIHLFTTDEIAWIVKASIAVSVCSVYPMWPTPNIDTGGKFLLFVTVSYIYCSGVQSPVGLLFNDRIIGSLGNEGEETAQPA